MFPWLEITVEVFIVYGILLKDHTIPRKQVWHSVCCHGSINKDLIFVLKEVKKRYRLYNRAIEALIMFEEKKSV